MEDNTESIKSIWGKWWSPIRKWFYPAWLIYETAIRFYDYAGSVHDYFLEQQDSLGDNSSQLIGTICGLMTFVVCLIFLTVPACFLLYQFFKRKNLSQTCFEEKVKPIF